MLKIRRSCDRVIFNMEIPIPRNEGLYIAARLTVPMCRHVPAHADIRHTNHMDFFICKLGCAGMCQHLKKCRHLGRCRHVPARLGADTCRHPWYYSYGLFFIWMLICADMCQYLKRCRHLGMCRHVPTRQGADTCRHVPTSVILIIWTFLFANWDVLACVNT